MTHATVTQTIKKCIEVRIVYRFPYYFYNRIGSGDDGVKSIKAAEARRIYEACQETVRQQIREGTPSFNGNTDAWAWSAWIVEEERNEHT